MLAGSEPPALPWGSALIGGSEPLRFEKRVMGAVGLSPVVQLMSMLRPTIETLRAQDGAQENEGAQDTPNDAASWCFRQQCKSTRGQVRCLRRKRESNPAARSTQGRLAVGKPVPCSMPTNLRDKPR